VTNGARGFAALPFVLRLRLGAAAVVFLLWVAVFISAAYVDRTLIAFAQISTVPMLGFVGAMVGKQGLEVFKGTGDE
jgi:hypothetical protein